MKPIHHYLKFCVFILFSSFFIACQPETPDPVFRGIPINEVLTETHTILDTWYPRIVDTINGGYWTNFEYDWTLSEDQVKMLVTQARGLWTAARAAEFFPDMPVFREAADHGFKFLTESMWDPLNGGFFQYYSERTAPPPGLAYKMTYGNAFALYALSQYAKINSDPKVLAWVKKCFQWMEENAHDSFKKGYHSIILPDEVRNTKDTALLAAVERIGWGQIDWKDQNTSIHLLEALTTTYQVLPEQAVRDRLGEMLHLVRDTMVNADGYLFLYFDNNWNPINHQDSSRAYILENLRYNHQSFGHDIETAYLLLDAAKSLYGEPDEKTLQVAKRLVDHTLAYGFEKDYYGIFDRGYQFAGQEEVEIVNRQKTWWSQAEAWHALVLFSTLFPEETIYQEAGEKMWSYIQKEMIDPEHNGWYNNGLDEDPDNKTARKAHQWKGAYHNGRALIQVLEYAK